MDLLKSADIIKYFDDRGYDCLPPHNIVNNNDTVFITAGIQPLIKYYQGQILLPNRKLFIPQPVIRTQYMNSIGEGSALSFVNVTSAQFNHSLSEHDMMVKDWYNFFYQLGLKKSNFETQTDIYEDDWGKNLHVEGIRTFHYYDGLEIGDTTYFTKINDDFQNLEIDSMSDLGFGLERLRWQLNGGSYYDLYEKNVEISLEVKAYLSAIALLTVNKVKPSNKNSGYRVRLFSKKLVQLLGIRDLNFYEHLYLNECLEYWKNWQQTCDAVDENVIMNELVRNGNRYILDVLSDIGYDELSKIDINVTRDDFFAKLNSFGLDMKKVRKLVK